MSVSASIQISLSNENNMNVPGSKILPILTHSGWRIFTTSGKVGYLSAESNNDFDWKYASLNFETLIDIFKEKEMKKETTGVCLFWGNTSIGGSFSFLYDNTMHTFSININEDRQLITLAENYNITNFQWYLEKLLPPLNNCFGIDFFSCNELR